MKRIRRSVTTTKPPALTRPYPPGELAEIAFEPEDSLFRPAPDALRWIRETFIESIHGSRLQNDEHLHLTMAKLGVLWTNGRNSRGGRMIVGTAEIPSTQGGKWLRGRMYQQLRDWFGEVPDFLITLSAPYSATVDDAAFCALVEHELYHCSQKLDAFGGPAFSRETGLPLWAIRGHDVEEFVGVVRRYGADAAGVRDLVDAANATPLLSAPAIAGACGTCLRRAA